MAESHGRSCWLLARCLRPCRPAPAAGTSAGACFLIALRHSPSARLPRGSWARVTPGLGRGAGEAHCGCPLRPCGRRKQGFPGLERVLPVPSQQLSAAALRVGCSRRAVHWEPVAALVQSCCGCAGKEEARESWGSLIDTIPLRQNSSPSPVLSYPQAESPLGQSTELCPDVPLSLPHPQCLCILTCNGPQEWGWCRVASCHCTSRRTIHSLPI